MLYQQNKIIYYFTPTAPFNSEFVVNMLERPGSQDLLILLTRQSRLETAVRGEIFEVENGNSVGEERESQ